MRKDLHKPPGIRVAIARLELTQQMGRAGRFAVPRARRHLRDDRGREERHRHRGATAPRRTPLFGTLAGRGPVVAAARFVPPNSSPPTPGIRPHIVEALIVIARCKRDETLAIDRHRIGIVFAEARYLDYGARLNAIARAEQRRHWIFQKARNLIFRIDVEKQTAASGRRHSWQKALFPEGQVHAVRHSRQCHPRKSSYGSHSSERAPSHRSSKGITLVAVRNRIRSGERVRLCRGIAAPVEGDTDFQ